MAAIIAIIAIGVIYIAAAALFKDEPRLSRRLLPCLLAGALALRVALALCVQGFPNDYACFYSWACSAFDNGLSTFYDSGMFTDYPPGYIYVLWLVGALLRLFNAGYQSHASFLIVKLPAIICDLAAALLLYRLARRRGGARRAEYVAALYLFNPTVIFDSSVWGQVDGVMCLALLGMCVLLSEKKTIPAYFAFAAGILLKPQMLVFTPVLIYGIIENVILEDFSWRRFWLNLLCGLAAIGAMALLCVPFGGPVKIISLYQSTMGSYPYATVNAYNFWALLGKNWVSQDGTLLFMSYSSWGTLSIALTVALSAMFFFRARSKASRYYTTAALIIVLVFLFSVRMHERYAFPALILLAAAYAVRPRRDLLAVYLALSLVFLYNMADVFLVYCAEGYYMDWTAIRYAGAAALAAGLALVITLWRCDVRRPKIENGGVKSA